MLKCCTTVNDEWLSLPGMRSAVFQLKPFNLLTSLLHVTRRQFRVRAPVNRSFQVAWFNWFKWIHHDFEQDSVYCFVC